MFKKILLLILFAGMISAGNNTRTDAKLNSVKVYTRGAMLNHSLTVDLKSGENIITIGGLAGSINENSIQIKGTGNALIQSFTKKTNYLLDPQKSDELKKLEEKLKSLKKEVKYKESEINVFELEERMVLENQKLGSDTKSVTVSELKSFAKFFKDKLTSIRKEKFELENLIEKLNEEITKIQKQINEIQGMNKNAVDEIEVVISSGSAQKANLELSYLINNAGWMPEYSIYVADLSKPVDLTYKAALWQRSGINWKNVDVTISTNRPRYGNKPELNPWFIDFIEDYRVSHKRSMMKQESLAGAVMAAKPAAADEMESMADYMEVNETLLSFEFKSKMKLNINSGARKKYIEIDKLDLPAEFKYYAAPKLSREVYLIGEVQKDKLRNLLPGRANVYFEGSFVGNTYVNTTDAEKTLTLSLGVDSNIKIERDMLKDFTEDKFLSSDIERIFGYEITVRNNRKNAINLLMEENIPISQQEDIVVELKEKSGAEFNSNTGILSWNINIKAGEEEVKKLVYSVRYPKDKKINNL